MYIVEEALTSVIQFVMLNNVSQNIIPLTINPNQPNTLHEEHSIKNTMMDTPSR